MSLLVDALIALVSPTGFEPHRYHFLNDPELMWFLIFGNVLVAIAYAVIALSLFYFVKKRKDLAFPHVFLMFGVFILLCAASKSVHIITFWYPLYWIQGIVDVATGIVAATAVFVMIPAIPQALRFPSPKELEEMNGKLSTEITMRKKSEAQVKRFNTELEQRVDERTRALVLANRELKRIEKRKDDFINMASHELRTPITSMNGYIYALKKKISSDKNGEIHLYIKKIQDQINKQTHLVADLLDATKIKGQSLLVEKSPFDLNDLVQNIVTDMSVTTDRHSIKVFGAIDGMVLGNRERIGQVLTNFLSNAIKFSPHAGDIFVSVEKQHAQAVVGVRDFGLGIKKKHLGKIFRRFYRVYEHNGTTYPGLGVGLYIASQIVEQNDGKVWVESEDGKGSTFYFSIPFATKNEAGFREGVSLGKKAPSLLLTN